MARVYGLFCLRLRGKQASIFVPLLIGNLPVSNSLSFVVLSKFWPYELISNLNITGDPMVF